MEYYDKMKENAGTFGTVVWLLTGTVLFISDFGFIGLFTWRALVFLFFGIFLAALLFGGISYYLQRGIAKLFLLTANPYKYENTIKIIALVKFILELALFIWLTTYAYKYFVESWGQ